MPSLSAAFVPFQSSVFEQPLMASHPCSLLRNGTTSVCAGTNVAYNIQQEHS
ncbi:hypothetical protein CERZMDRAFT_90074, partial [Cercospora zeae-maydis SCOH1-5]